MNSEPDTEQDLSIQQCDPVRKAREGRVRCRVLRGDSLLGEFVLVQSDDGWLPIPEPGSLHEGLLHTTAIDFARQVNEGRIALD